MEILLTNQFGYLADSVHSLTVYQVFSLTVYWLCVYLDKGVDHWETVYALLEEETLNLFNDQNAAGEV